MIKVLFFAQVRELVGTDATEVAADFPTVEALRQHMAAQSDRWALALEDGRLIEARKILKDLELAVGDVRDNASLKRGQVTIAAAIVLAAANFFAILDMTIANVSVPSIAGGLAV